jgi:hypothetical protein
MALTKDQILESNDLKNIEVEVPEWGGSVLVRTMTGADRAAFEESMVDVQPDGTRKANVSNLRLKLVALTVVDDAGNRMFGIDDIERLGLKSSAAIERVFEAAQRINGMSADSKAQAAKNSESVQSGASTSV